MLAHNSFPHLINSYSSSSTISFVNDTFAVGEGETELKIMEVLKQQVWKSATASLFFFFFFRLKKVNKMYSDYNLMIFSKRQGSQFGKKQKRNA